MHPVACRGDFNHILWLGPFWIGLPQVVFAAAIPVLTGFGLGMFRIFQGVAAVRDSYVINVEGKVPAFSEVQDALVGAAPV